MGPLTGVRVVELAGTPPGSFACMVLSDLGADVLRVGRADRPDPPDDPLGHGHRRVDVDLKAPGGAQRVLRLVEDADVLVEGFRPGVAERLGVGPDECRAVNPRLVYGRLTGWGQTGPLSGRAGHDVNYVALAGALGPIGRDGEPPVPPLNLLGDFAGGGLLLAVGVVAALHERDRSGEGQVVDAAMVDGVALLTSWLRGQRASGAWTDERGTNLLDGGAPCYGVYETSDGRYVAVGALERRFYARLVEGLGLDPADLPDQYDRTRWPELRTRIAAAFRTRTRDEWAKLFADTDACVTPVLSPEEAAVHPHAVAREAYTTAGGVVRPAPAPRFSRTPTARRESG